MYIQKGVLERCISPLKVQIVVAVWVSCGTGRGACQRVHVWTSGVHDGTVLTLVAQLEGIVTCTGSEYSERRRARHRRREST